MNRFLHFAVFALGLAAVGWIGAGYVASNPLALAITALIGVVYLIGALEQHRYQQATTTLMQAITAISEAPANLGDWLSRLHPSLRVSTRLRIEGERVGLPGAALTPYLVGLLVLLGMLGTFLGMVATLRGTGLALESATDLQAIRASLAAPVKGLGFAFGTSVAGVASSAMLGLLAALCRRERGRAAQMLDAQIATTLRPYSRPHQRDEGFKLLQGQADAMPIVVDLLRQQAQATPSIVDLLQKQAEAMPAMVAGLHAMMTAMEQQNQALNERLAASQEASQARTEAAYTQLAGAVEQSLKNSIAEGASAAGAAIQPVVATTMAGIARETATLHDSVTRAVQQQLTGLSAHFEASTKSVEATMATLSRQTAATQDAVLQATQQQLEGVSARFAETTTTVTDIWTNALAQQQQASESLSNDLRISLDGFAETFGERATSLLDNVATRLDDVASTLSENWDNALSRQTVAGEKLADDNQQALTAAVASLEQHAGSLVRTVNQSHGELRADLASQDEQRLAAWTDGLNAMVATLRQEWEQAGEHTASRQQEICDALAQTARDISSETHAHASSTIAELALLVQAAAEAPKAAADVITEVRQKLSDSMARDNAMLEERSRLLETLGTLLDAVNHASSEQRAAVDALVATSADVLDRVGIQFTDKVETEIEKLTGKVETATASLTDKVETETGKLAGVAAHVTSSAIEVASLGEAFGTAVQLFSQSNTSLVEHLQRIEAALGKSATRSDEQLAYYVAQAREVIDLSMMSQKQIIEELQQLGGQRTPSGTVAA